MRLGMGLDVRLDMGFPIRLKFIIRMMFEQD
jgi:hypothetical protein